MVNPNEIYNHQDRSKNYDLLNNQSEMDREYYPQDKKALIQKLKYLFYPIVEAYLRFLMTLNISLVGVVFGAVGTAGQRCTTTRRVFVHSSIYDEFKDNSNLKGPVSNDQIDNDQIDSKQDEINNLRLTINE